MILTKKITIKASGKYIKILRALKMDFNYLEPIDIDVKYLPKSSSKKIDVECEICHTKYNIPYNKYNKNISNGGYYSCIKCRKFKTKIKNKERYGDENYNNRKQCKETVQKRYNVKNVSQLDSIKNKKKIKSLEKYGVENISQSKEIKNIKSNTIFNKNKIKITNLKSYINNEYVIYCTNCKKEYKIIREQYNNRIKHNLPTCTNCFPISSLKSKKEELLLEYIKDMFDGEIILSDRTILNGQEIDIFIPDLKIAFEFNGLYWHSITFKDKEYHFNKTNTLLKKNILLFHIWENEWDINIKNKLKKILTNDFCLSEKRRYIKLNIVKYNSNIFNYYDDGFNFFQKMK